MDVRRQIADSRRVRSQRSLRPRLDVLETRSLLSVTFTGNVAHDFPSDGKGVAVAADNPLVMHPMITQSLKEIVKVSGFDISGIRLLYTPEDDTLSIGIEQPSNQTSGQPVIAGDADNNGDSGSVSPAVIAITPGFQDIEGLGHSESLGVFLDLKGTGYADVVAGFSDGDPRMVKQFQVAQAVVDTSLPPFTPQFGTELPQFEGNVYLDNSPDHPNLEFSITQFSKLYQSITGKALIPFATIGVGGFGRSAEDTGIGEEGGCQRESLPHAQ